MKKLLLSICIGIALTVTPVTFNSCSNYGTNPTLSQSASDQIILRAEQSAETAKLTFNTFVHLERDNEAMLKEVNPGIHVWAENIRKNGIGWIQSLRTATKDFKANRTSENQATLNGILLTLTQIINETNKYITQSKKAVSP